MDLPCQVKLDYHLGSSTIDLTLLRLSADRSKPVVEKRDPTQVLKALVPSNLKGFERPVMLAS